jgi:DNA polymerase
VPLSGQVDVAGFHTEATRLLAQQVPPQSVEWSAAPALSTDEQQVEGARAQIRNRAARAIIPQSFVRMSELVVLHRDTGRFDLLYRTLWRLVYEPDLKHDFTDADLGRLRQMAQAVRRDIQKMKTRVAFEPQVVKGRSVGVCWYEPAHFICETVAGWLASGNPGVQWLLLTPERSLRWDGEHLLAAPALPLEQQPGKVRPQDWPQVLEALSWA